MKPELARGVATIWEEALGNEVNPGAEFFAMGGDSLTAMRIIAELSRAYETDVPLRMLFDNPECGQFIDALAEFLVADGAAKTAP